MFCYPLQARASTRYRTPNPPYEGNHFVALADGNMNQKYRVDRRGCHARTSTSLESMELSKEGMYEDDFVNNKAICTAYTYIVTDKTPAEAPATPSSSRNNMLTRPVSYALAALDGRDAFVG